MKTSLLLIFAFLFGLAAAGQKSGLFTPGELWPDNKGVHINAHGGGTLFYDGKYYWFGEHKTEGGRGNQAWVGVHCYSSENLYDWEDEGVAFAVSENPESPVTAGCIIERPKVIYNAKTGKFVMWFHLELKGQGYKAAQTGVAIADNQTAVYPQNSPGGWNIIGKTALELFDKNLRNLTIFEIGNKVKFNPISKKEFLSQGGSL